MFQLFFYVPETHLEPVKQSVFDAGAGKYNDYDCCCWQVKGSGQFRPLESSRPFIGEQGRIEKVEEYRVEMIVKDELLKGVVKALLAAHPYEEPAYGVLKLTELP